MINASASFGQTTRYLRLRNHRLPLRNLRLRSKDVNMAKAEKAPPAERRLRLAASARRAQLVDVGRKVFAERGYEATSVEEIAERAGISKPIVYEHFGGKEGLYAVIVDREIEQIVSCPSGRRCWRRREGVHDGGEEG